VTQVIVLIATVALSGVYLIRQWWTRELE